MGIDDLRSFLAVATSHDPLIDVASSLGIGQPTLSRRLARVETYAGATLFDRAGRSLVLNTRGRAFVVRARAALEALEGGRAEVRRLMDPERGTIRLDFMHSLGTWMVPDILREYRRQHPDVHFELHQGAASYLLDRVRSDASDLALVGPRPDADMQWQQLARQRLAVAVPAGEGSGPIALEDVADARWIGVLPGYGTRTLLDTLTAAAGFRPDVVFESMELTTVAGLVAAGLGVALLPLGDPNLQILGIELRPIEPAAYRELGVAWRGDGPGGSGGAVSGGAGGAVGPAVAQFLEFLQDWAGPAGLE
ncbi:LysR family transcriptional regulator [Corynebacterium renale]|uniref:LysR family transcriptional regulator n=1 Tax=Corynebacterium renale TaxID=1724 RepID=UPI000DFA57FE|nr:LysR family transcriptional regulator [Corynebacterium renale]STD00557.1 transcriptional regulator [Corynebacterium renale]